MGPITTIIIAILSSGFIAAIVSAIMQKQNEKESRLFNAKLEVYKDFAIHLQGKFTSLTKEGRDLDIPTLAEISAQCLLVSNKTLNEELKDFLMYVNHVYERCSASDFDELKEKNIFDKIWSDANKIENLMREDLGFK